jgi:hypothetical protein
VLTWKLETGALTNPTITPETSPRGIKRSRSPDTYGDLQQGDGLGDDGMCPLAEQFVTSIYWSRCACSHVLLRVLPTLEQFADDVSF